jgi:type 2 lantibiotic biosynthesis protein LanM
VARARTLDERLALGRAAAGRREGSDEERRSLVQRWSCWFSAGDAVALERRLSWDGWSPPALSAMLGAPEEREEGGASPAQESWIGMFEDLVQACSARRGRGAGVARRLLDGRGAPPFAPLWVPWVNAARRRLLAGCPALADEFGPGAIAALERALLRQLCGISATILMERFEAERTAAGVHSEAGAFDRFVDRMRAGGLLDLLLEFPTLARLLTRLTETWVDSSAELARRVRRDRRALERTFGSGRRLGRVRALRCDLSDRHGGGRQVAQLRFAGGVEVVYKPRDLRIEERYHGFVAWLRAKGAGPPLPALTVLVRDGYGWVEKARQGPLAGEAETNEYFRRAGALLCVAHVLGASDLHMDNVVATRDGPVLIDAETLLQPEWAADPRAGGGTDRTSGFESAARTGLLAFPSQDPQGCFVDIGGLRGAGGYLVAERARRWRDVNTDTMGVFAEPALAPSQRNEVWAGGRRRRPADHAAEIRDGFASMYRDLERLRAVILRSRQGIPRFSGVRTRVVLRPSQAYASLLVGLLAPRFLRDGLERSIAIDVLNRPFAGARRRPRLWPLAAEERQALDGLDIPVFTIGVGERRLRARTGESIEGMISHSGLRCVRRRLARLSEDDLERQLASVGRVMRLPEGRHSLLVEENAALSPTAGLASNAVPRDLLLEVAGELADHAARGLSRVRRGDLYGGSLGIAMFLAAWSSVTGERTHRDAVLRVCSRVARNAVSAGSPETGCLGACSGLGGVLYGLAAIGTLLGEPGLLDDAVGVAGLVDRNRIREDRRLDVEGGAAGGVLGLLAVHGAAHRGDALAAAEACGRHLLEHARVAEDETLCWPGRDGVPRAGFAHGAAGIAWALAALHGATGDERLRAACLRACEWERRCFDAGLGAWPVLAGPGHDPARNRVVMGGWCHGAAGIGLSRAAILTRLAGAGLSEDLRLAVGLMRTAHAGGHDHLCCGSFGITESLVTIARLGFLEDGIVTASSRAASTLGRAMIGGSFNVSQTRSGDRELGLFRGVSGIGYALLRLAAPATVPPVLLFAVASEGGR